MVQTLNLFRCIRFQRGTSSIGSRGNGRRARTDGRTTQRREKLSSARSPGSRGAHVKTRPDVAGPVLDDPDPTGPRVLVDTRRFPMSKRFGFPFDSELERNRANRL